MFEAFRCARPLAGAPAACPAQAIAAAASPEPVQRAKKRRKRQDSDDQLAASAAAAGGKPAEPGGGLALEKMGDQPLRLVIVGHNPSNHAWASGHFYSNPSNRMWPILRETGLAPRGAIRGAQDDGRMPEVAGVGFTDVGSGTPGTDSSQFSSQHFQAWRPAFFARLAAQAARAARAIGCTCGRCGAPRVVAFSGKRQFQELFLSSGGGSGNKRSPGKGPGAGRASGGTGPRQAGEPGPPQPHNDCSSAGDRPCLDGLPAAAPTPVPGASEAAEAAGEEPQQAARGPAPAPTLQARRPGRVEVGRQWVLPEGWPLPLDTEVWVMTSTSGAAPMSNEQRLAPWRALAQRLEGEAWPQWRMPLCAGGASAAAAHGGGRTAGRAGS